MANVKIIEQKAGVVAEIKEKFEKAKSVVMFDYRGLSVAEVTELRRKLREAGADYVGDVDMIEKIEKESWFDYDVIIATPEMMPMLGKIGKILGPKGLMPNPKSGTVTMDVAKAINDIKAGKIEYRLDKTNIIHCPIGKASFGEEKLTENFKTLMSAIVKAKPASAKGQYLKSISVSATMGPGIKVSTSKVAE